MMGVAVAATIVVPAAAIEHPLAYSANRRRLFSTATSTSSSFFVLRSEAFCSRLRSTSSSTAPAVPEPPRAGDGVTDQGRHDDGDDEALSLSGSDDAGLGVEVEKVGGKKRKNRRRIRAQVAVDAALNTVWGVLTDYEGLASFIPNLAVSRLLDRRDNFARLYQVGQQDLALGLTFDAKGVLDCYERDLEELPTGVRRRNIDFAMVEGDFSTFEGRWSIQQNDSKGELLGKRFQTTLIYVVELEPKLWLPIGLIEGRLCNEVKNNLFSVRDEAQRVQRLKDGLLT